MTYRNSQSVTWSDQRQEPVCDAVTLVTHHVRSRALEPTLQQHPTRKDTPHMNREERKRIVSETRERLQEAVTAHTVSDEESALALIDMHLDDRQAALEQLQRDDPLGFGMFGEYDVWIERQLSRTRRND